MIVKNYKVKISCQEPSHDHHKSQRNQTCSDAYLLKELAFAKLCVNCRSYLSIPYKKKSEMGTHDFQFKMPGKESQCGDCLPSPEPTERRKCPTSHKFSSEKLIMIQRPRIKRRDAIIKQ